MQVVRPAGESLGYHGRPVDLAISPDGRITGQAEGITLAGRQHGKKLEGDVTNGICGLHFTVQKQEF